MGNFLKVKLIGFTKVQTDFRKLKGAAPVIQRRFMDLISRSTITLLRANTPVDTGELKAGWAILNRTATTIDVGFRQRHLADRLFFVTQGTVHTPANFFLRNVQNGMLDLTMDILQNELKRAHPHFRTVNLRAAGSGGGSGLQAGGGLGSGHPSKVGRSIGGRGRKFQQVGRTSVGPKVTSDGSLKFGHRQSGGAQVKRVGTGSKRLGRRLSLRRRRGKDVRSTIKALLG
jgi:hypothetical protein